MGTTSPSLRPGSPLACAALGCATAGIAAMLGLAVATLLAAAPWMILGAPSRA